MTGISAGAMGALVTLAGLPPIWVQAGDIGHDLSPRRYRAACLALAAWGLVEVDVHALPSKTHSGTQRAMVVRVTELGRAVVAAHIRNKNAA